MRAISFSMASSRNIGYPYESRVEIGFTHSSQRDIKIRMPEFIALTTLNQSVAQAHRTAHMETAFSMDPLLQSQADPMDLGTLDNFMLLFEKASSPMAITKQPQNVIGMPGDTITFTVGVSGDVRTWWQRSDDNLSTWTDITSGATGFSSTTLSVTLTASTNYNRYYRCKVTSISDSQAIIYSDPVCVIPRAVDIVSQPTNQSGDGVSTVTFTFEANYWKNSLLWQRRTASGSTWSTQSTTTQPSLSVPSSSTYIYRCRLQGYDGKYVYTNEVKVI